MAPEQIILELQAKAVNVWSALRDRLSRLSGRWAVLLVLTVLVVWAAFLRTMHLLNPDNYFILSPDSFFFHWSAGKILAEHPPPSFPGASEAFTLGSGLSYPIAYLGKAASYIPGISTQDALNLACKIVPVLIGVIGLILIYLVVSKLWNRRLGLFSVFVWAVMYQAVFFTSAGYTDRDGLSMLLLMTGAFIFLISKGWRFNVGSRNIGWMVAGLGILLVEGLLYVEWRLHGPVLLFGMIVVYFVVASLLKYLETAGKEPTVAGRLRAALGEVNWQTFAVVLLGNILAFALDTDKFSSWFNMMTSLVGAFGESGVAELQGIGLGDLVAYQLFLVPMVLGIYVAFRWRTQGALFFACWFLSFFILSLFVGRTLNYAVPAACVLAGIGLAYLWGWSKGAPYSTWKRGVVVALLVLLLLISFVIIPLSASNPLIAIAKEWQETLTYIKDSTPQDAVIMAHWGWGYWILDLGQRRPVVDNGYYGHSSEKNRDMALAYVASEPSEAVKIMEKYGASYLVFSKLDFNMETTILSWAHLEDKYDTFPEDSMVLRCLNGEFQGGGGLEVVYRSNPDSEVVVLGLTSP